MPRIENLPPKKLVGKKLRMSFTHDRTFALWSSFMPARKNITNAVSPFLYSLQVYGQVPFLKEQWDLEFDKWAAVEVSDFNAVPADMESLELPGGLYAVFLHKGNAAAVAETFRYIFNTWLPNSGYTLDNRPHFELLGEKYKHGHPDSEEEIWIPVRLVE